MSVTHFMIGNIWRIHSEYICMKHGRLMPLTTLDNIFKWWCLYLHWYLILYLYWYLILYLYSKRKKPAANPCISCTPEAAKMREGGRAGQPRRCIPSVLSLEMHCIALYCIVLLCIPSVLGDASKRIFHALKRFGMCQDGEKEILILFVNTHLIKSILYDTWSKSQSKVKWAS